jgi:hypothetical protein
LDEESENAGGESCVSAPQISTRSASRLLPGRLRSLLEFDRSAAMRRPPSGTELWPKRRRANVDNLELRTTWVVRFGNIISGAPSVTAIADRSISPYFSSISSGD